MIKLVVFDLSGVVFTNGKTIAAEKLSNQFNISKEKIISLFENDLANKYYLGLIEPVEFWNKVSKELKIDLKVLRNTWIESYKLIEESKLFIESLKKKGFKTAALSESPEERVNYQEEKYRLYTLFDYSVYSFETKTPKPSIELFELLISKSRINPAESTYIDDQEKNLEIPKQLGYKTILAQNNFVSEVESFLYN